MFADHHPGLLLQRAAPIAHNVTEGDIGQTSDTANALHGNASLYFRDCHYFGLSIVQRIACHVFCNVGCWSLLVPTVTLTPHQAKLGGAAFTSSSWMRISPQNQRVQRAMQGPVKICLPCKLPCSDGMTPIGQQCH